MTTTLNNNNSENTPKQHRSKRIELIIVPGRSLGPFRLGSSLWDTLQFLSDRPHFFPSVELKYSQQDPLEYDFIVALPANGINLRFDGNLQRLKSVECYDPDKVKLVYQNSEVSSSRTIPTFLLIYKAFGPTYPGEFDSSQCIYTLKYPGLAFTFPIPARYKDYYISSTELPMELPDGTTPIASKAALYSNSDTWQLAAVPPLPKILAEHNASNSTKYGKLGKREAESVIAKPTKGITLLFPISANILENTNNLNNTGTDKKVSSSPSVNTSLTSSTNNPSTTAIVNYSVSILLNVTTAQDILADLGKPSRIFYKEEDKMKIHSVTTDHHHNYHNHHHRHHSHHSHHNGNIAHNNNHPLESKSSGDTTAANGSGGVDDKDKDPSIVQPTDYFFNYFHLGIDILIDGGLHVCKKIVLHGNVPGHYDFQRYKRCPFQMLFPKDKSKNKPELVDVEDENEHLITADMKISTIQEHIPWETSNTAIQEGGNQQEQQQKPVILTRGSSEQNPFGSTYLTGYDEGVVMEVMKNGYVPTIVLY